MTGGGPSQRLLVEGPDDRWALINLLEARGDWSFALHRPFIDDHARNWQGVLAALGPALKTTEVVGVVVDANASPEGRWAAVRRESAAAGIELPEAAPREGWVGPGLLPGSRYGVFLLPAPGEAGSLDTLLLDLVPPGPLWFHATEACTEARTIGAGFAPSDEGKARLHTFLAWQSEPGVPYGRALKSGYLGRDSARVQRFAAWFVRLFGGPDE